MRNAELKLFMPKFKIQYNYSLKSVFSKMGVNALFTPGKANLSGMTGNPQAVVSNIAQTITLAINEEGVDVAGASRTEVVDGSFGEMKVNKEFFFMVKHMQSNLILFWGRICVPKWHEKPQ